MMIDYTITSRQSNLEPARMLWTFIRRAVSTAIIAGLIVIMLRYAFGVI